MHTLGATVKISKDHPTTVNGGKYQENICVYYKIYNIDPQASTKNLKMDQNLPILRQSVTKTTETCYILIKKAQKMFDFLHFIVALFLISDKIFSRSLQNPLS